MRNIIVSEYVTLDGVMEDPGGGEKTLHYGWSFDSGMRRQRSTSSINCLRLAHFCWAE